MEDIIIVGAGGVGKETAMLVEDINKISPTWNLLGFVDDDRSLTGSKINGYDVLGPIGVLNEYKKKINVICSISNPKIKKVILNRITNNNISFAKLIHPSAIISPDCKIGEDVIIQANCVITTNITIGNHVQMNPQCGIGHESIIRDYNSLYWNVNISGNVEVGEGCILGTKATILQGLKIGNDTIVGAGAVVIDNLPADCTAVGVPARIIKENHHG